MKVVGYLFTPFYLIWMILITLISLFLFIPFGILRVCRLNMLGFYYMKLMARLIGFLYLAGAFPIFKISGKEHIPKKARNLCIMANHQSYADIAFITVGLRMRAGFIAKKELFKVPILRVWLYGLNCVSINRNNSKASMASILRGIHNIKTGFPMVIFPEATRSRGNGMRRFRTGSFKLAFKSESIILPVTIDGAYQLIEKYNLILPFQRIRITFHPSIETQSLSDAKKDELPEKVWGIINSGLRVPNQEVLPDKKF